MSVHRSADAFAPDPVPLAASRAHAAPGGPSPARAGARTTLTRAAAALALLASASAPAVGQGVEELRGVWAAERYWMAGGAVHEVRGRIFFTDSEWQVLFFVVDEAGEVRRGSGEGGSYALRDGRLVFTHLFNLSVGEEMRGLPAADLRMVARAPEGAPLEPTDLGIQGDVLTLRFPSGNRMTFRRRR